MYKLLKYAIYLVIVILLFVLADYFALFGTKSKKVLDFSIIHFKTVDEQTGAPIFSAHIKCYRHRNQDICQERQGKKKDIVSAYFPLHKVQENTFLFTKDEKIPTAAEPMFKIMFIHNDYQKVSKDFDMNEIYNNSGAEIEVKMKSQNFENESGIE